MTLIAIIIGYLIGSLSSAILISKLLSHPDPRQHKQMNAFVQRIGHNRAIAIMGCDALKGFVAVFIGRILGLGDDALACMVVASVIGHIMSLFFGFTGGKGFSTFVGGLIGMSFVAGLLTLLVWFVTLLVTRYLSLASIIAAATSFILFYLFSDPDYVFAVMLSAGIVIFAYRDNINALLNQEEPKLDF